MIPLRDNIRSRSVPFVNYGLIASCAVVFFLQLQETGDRGAGLVERFGMVPRRVIHPDEPVHIEDVQRDGYGRPVRVRYEMPPSPIPAWLTLLTCIFLHGGWLHFIGNMWFLYIFGDNVEDRFGHLGYLAFYLLAGVGASAAHLLTSPDSGVPTIGASGAIAGVMGSYLLLYPRATVLTLVPIFFFFYLMVLPAPLFLGIWFLLQFFQGTLAITTTQVGGVAWWAHIGGFVFGLAAVVVLRQAGALKPRGRIIRRATSSYRWRRGERPW
jgi:membrane associated rhomboid family serine protease